MKDCCRLEILKFIEWKLDQGHGTSLTHAIDNEALGIYFKEQNERDPRID